MSRANVFELLNLRTQWEEIVKDFKMDETRKEGTVDNLKWFVEHGMFTNRFRKGYDQAKNIAYEILVNA